MSQEGQWRGTSSWDGERAECFVVDPEPPKPVVQTDAVIEAKLKKIADLDDRIGRLMSQRADAQDELADLMRRRR